MKVISFLQKVRRALVPMRQATIDAFLLTMLTAICLVELGIPVTYPFLFVLVIVLVFTLVYAIALILRLRQAARQMMIVLERDQLLERSAQERSSESFYIELLLGWVDLQ